MANLPSCITPQSLAREGAREGNGGNREQCHGSPTTAPQTVALAPTPPTLLVNHVPTGKPTPTLPPPPCPKAAVGGSPLPVLGSHVDAPGQWQAPLPSSAWTRHRAVKQGQSGGSVGTTSQGKGRVSRGVRIGQGGRGRAQSVERLMGTAACACKGSKGRAESGDRPMGAASCRPKHTKVSYQPPPPPSPRLLSRSTARTHGLHAHRAHLQPPHPFSANFAVIWLYSAVPTPFKWVLRRNMNKAPACLCGSVMTDPLCRPEAHLDSCVLCPIPRCRSPLPLAAPLQDLPPQLLPYPHNTASGPPMPEVEGGAAMTPAPPFPPLVSGDILVVGHSLGGGLGVCLAGMLPECVHGLLLVDGLGLVTRDLTGAASHFRQGLFSRRFVRARLGRPPKSYASVREAVEARCAAAQQMPGKQLLGTAAAWPMVCRSLVPCGPGVETDGLPTGSDCGCVASPGF